MRERPAAVRPLPPEGRPGSPIATAATRVSRSSVVLLGACLLALFAGLGASLGLALALIPERLDLVHIAAFNVCQMRAHAWHWQNPQRLPALLRYDFTKSPDSFVMLEVWVHNGPTLSLSQRLTWPCG
jgi:hypothetical protein